MKEKWKKVIAKEEHPQVMICEKCNSHHWHIIRMMHTKYAQCGECKEMVKL